MMSDSNNYSDLTPRENEILILIREGRDDEAIAERLGLALGAVHYHVANIYAKLGVSNRLEAADWEPRDEPEKPPRPIATAPVSTEHTDEIKSTDAEPPQATVTEESPSIRAGLAALAAMFAVIALIIGGGAVLGLDLGGSDTDSDAVAAVSPTRTQRPARTNVPRTSVPIPTFAPTPEPFKPGFDYDTLAVAQGSAFPIDVAIIVSTGCWFCEVGPNGLVRVYRRPDGTLAQDVLLDPTALGRTRIDSHEGVDVEVYPYVHSLAVDRNGSRIIASLCVNEYCGGLVPAHDDAELMTLYSTDGGITWEKIESPPLSAYFAGFTRDGPLVYEWSVDNQTGSYYLWPDALPYEAPPANATRLVIGDTGDIFWTNDSGKLYDRYRNLIVDLSDYGYDYVNITAISGSHEKGNFLVQWNAHHQGSSTDALLSEFVGFPGEDKLTARGWTLSVPGSWRPIFDPKSARVFTNVDSFLVDPDPEPEPGNIINFGPIPAIVDLSRNVVIPIPHPFKDEDFAIPNQRNLIEAVQYGPFARVTGTGSCLNVRSGPSLDSPVIDCMADGVLLSYFDAVAPDIPPNTDWLNVTTPSGTHGFVSRDYVEY
jgi:DNA-binding CsgD family transcriptional regulator